MTRTGYYEFDRLPEGCAWCYIEDEERGGWRTNIYSVEVKGNGCGGAFTTADDVEAFWDGLLGGRLISPELLEQMIAVQAKDDDERYGLGLWIMETDSGLLIPRFEGCDPGVGFVTACVPDTMESVTILANTDSDIWGAHHRILAALLDDRAK